MAYPQGINFRATLGFVTDVSPEEFENGLVGIDYPRTTAQGNTVGFEQYGNMDSRDRNAGLDRRLAGLNFNFIAQSDFRFDLPASGSWNVRLAAGDANNSQPTAIDLYDSSTSLGSLATGSTSAAGQFKDATNTEYSAANWPGSNSAVTKTFTTTICRIRLLNNGAVNAIAHVRLDAAAAPKASNKPLLIKQAIRRASFY